MSFFFFSDIYLRTFYCQLRTTALFSMLAHCCGSLWFPQSYKKSDIVWISSHGFTKISRQQPWMKLWF